ncbi:hypothetical protein [Kineococcus rubinsiae]|uniref:hypothetical protein n=1 Tax=Kineococcus rubinsiae TaxID=2609562 RepID=UPI001430545D|nr:hypothetical protein [Kineococcus rubinsiae]NIZ90047.1 hypothetical protein [Kineococcus rubinsiae]
MSPSGRTSDCSPSEGRVRLEQARAFLEVAELVLDEADDGLATPQAVELLATVLPDGPSMAKDLRRLLEIKDQAHYAATMISGPRAEQAAQWARRLYDLAVRAG